MPFVFQDFPEVYQRRKPAVDRNVHHADIAFFRHQDIVQVRNHQIGEIERIAHFVVQQPVFQCHIKRRRAVFKPDRAVRPDNDIGNAALKRKVHIRKRKLLPRFRFRHIQRRIGNADVVDKTFQIQPLRRIKPLHKIFKLGKVEFQLLEGARRPPPLAPFLQRLGRQRFPVPDGSYSASRLSARASDFLSPFFFAGISRQRFSAAHYRFPVAHCRFSVAHYRFSARSRFAGSGRTVLVRSCRIRVCRICFVFAAFQPVRSRNLHPRPLNRD